MNSIAKRSLLILISPAFHNPEVFFGTVQWSLILVRFLLNNKLCSATFISAKVYYFFYRNNAFTQYGTFVTAPHFARFISFYFILHMHQFKATGVLFYYVHSNAP